MYCGFESPAWTWLNLTLIEEPIMRLSDCGLSLQDWFGPQHRRLSDQFQPNSDDLIIMCTSHKRGRQLTKYWVEVYVYISSNCHMIFFKWREKVAALIGSYCTLSLTCVYFDKRYKNEWLENFSRLVIERIEPRQLRVITSLAAAGWIVVQEAGLRV